MNKNHYYSATSYIHCNIDSNYIVITITEYQTCRCHSSIHHYHQTSITSNPTVQHYHLTHIHPHRTQTNSHPLPPLKGNSSPTTMILLGLAPPTTTISPHHYTGKPKLISCSRSPTIAWRHSHKPKSQYCLYSKL